MGEGRASTERFIDSSCLQFYDYSLRYFSHCFVFVLSCAVSLFALLPLHSYLAHVSRKCNLKSTGNSQSRATHRRIRVHCEIIANIVSEFEH